MAQVKVDVSDKIIDEAVKKQIRSLKGQVARLQIANNKLKRQVHEGKELVDRARQIIMAVKDAGNFPMDDDY